MDLDGAATVAARSAVSTVRWSMVHGMLWIMCQVLIPLI